MTNDIESIYVPALNKMVSRLGFGCCPMGGHGWGITDEKELIRAVHAALDYSINFFDTADIYGIGVSENVLGVGLMDEVSLAYGEETEWHCRFKKKGWEIIFYPEAEVFHYGEQITKNQPLYIEEEKIKGLLNFYKKHKSKFSYYFLRVIIIFTFFFRYVSSLIILKRKTDDLYLHIIKIAQNPEEVFKSKKIF